MTFRRMDPSYQFQSTLSVRRATWAGKRADAQGHISIHALREESDISLTRLGTQRVISIHALREESDACTTAVILLMTDFNPRSP